MISPASASLLLWHWLAEPHDLGEHHINKFCPFGGCTFINFSATVRAFTINLGVFINMGPEEEIWPVVLIAGSIVAVLMILAFSDPGTFVCVGVCE